MPANGSSSTVSSAWRLDGARALVTGGSSGIGLAVARELAALGASLVLVARDEQKLESARQQISDDFAVSDVEIISADLSRDEDRRRVAGRIRGGLQILVNNAGFNIRKKMSELSLDEYRQVQQGNTESCFEMCRLLYPRLAQAGSACVVNNASVAGLVHLRTGAPYGMSKAAMLQMTRNLAVEWAPDGIRVNAVAPWYIRTPLADQVLTDERYRREVLDHTPMGRVGEVEECARAIAFLALPASSYITGVCLPVDGGFTALGF